MFDVKRLCAVVLLAMPLPLAAQEVAITLDDLPYVRLSRVTPAEGMQIVQQVTHALETHGIIATGFVVGQQVKGERIPAVQAFKDAGHTIGNHSWSHPDYNTLTAEAFEQETRQTDAVLERWIDGPRYYRFPFLKEGETEQAKAAARAVLHNLGYVNVPVSIDNDDWKFNADYMDALDAGDTARAVQIADAYLAHMQDRTVHFQELAQQALGRDVRHILLMHMNRINADHLDKLLAWYAAEGWAFVSVAQALEDPLYAAPDLYRGPRGLSQIERVMGRKSE